MKFEIMNRWSGNVMFACELTAEIAMTARALVLGGCSAAMALTKVYSRIHAEAAAKQRGGL